MWWLNSPFPVHFSSLIPRMSPFTLAISCLSNSNLPDMPFQIFAVERQNQGNYKLPWHIWCHFLDLTWSKQPWFGPFKAEAKHSSSPTWWKLPWWKLSVKKTQCSGSDKKPSTLETGTGSTLETGTANTNLTESSRGSLSESRRSPVNFFSLLGVT